MLVCSHPTAWVGNALFRVLLHESMFAEGSVACSLRGLLTEAWTVKIMESAKRTITACKTGAEAEEMSVGA
jgi:hypothetical protein